MSVVQFRIRQDLRSRPGAHSGDVRLQARLAAIELASEALAEVLRGTLCAAKLVKHFTERPTPASRHLLDIVYLELQKTLISLESLLESLKSL